MISKQDIERVYRDVDELTGRRGPTEKPKSAVLRGEYRHDRLAMMAELRELRKRVDALEEVDAPPEESEGG